MAFKATISRQADADSKLIHVAEMLTDFVDKTTLIIDEIDKSAESAVLVTKQLLGNAFFAGSRRMDLQDARVALHRVKIQCNSVMNSLQGLLGALTMNNSLGTRTDAERGDRWDRLLAAVGGDDQKAFTAYKRSLNAWSVRLTDDIKELGTNKTVSSAKARVQELIQVASPQVLAALGTAGVCATGLLSAEVVCLPLGVCICAVALVLGCASASKFMVYGAHTSQRALTKVDELLTDIGGAAKKVDATFVKIFEEGDDPHEHVQALEDLCRNGGLAGELEKLVSELEGTVQSLA